MSLLAGEGTGLAMAQAYVLAGEPHFAQGDRRAAFVRHQERLHSCTKGKQATATKFASTFAPKTAIGITLRNWMSQFMPRITTAADSSSELST